jgi:hypothetical protein
MAERPEAYNEAIRELIAADASARQVVQGVFLALPAVQQMRRFLRAQPPGPIQKTAIYAGFFSYPPVVRYCNARGIPPATPTGAAHRCPFLLNVLEALGILDQSPSAVTLL